MARDPIRERDGAPVRWLAYGITVPGRSGPRSAAGSTAADRRGDRAVHAAAGGDPRARGRLGGPRPARRGAHRPPATSGPRVHARPRPARPPARPVTAPGTLGGGPAASRCARE